MSAAIDYRELLKKLILATNGEWSYFHSSQYHPITNEEYAEMRKLSYEGDIEHTARHIDWMSQNWCQGCDKYKPDCECEK